jgi:predicted TIM-barrel fold metal-dependent hydrolase
MRITDRRLTRRHLLCGLAGATLGAGITREVVSAQNTGSSNPRRIDLHHHFGSPRWIKRVAEVKRQGWDRFRDYTPQRAIETMDEGGTQTAIISCTEPGVWFGDDFSKERQQAIGLARDMNDYGARMISDYKGRFGLFAVLPLPDIDASLKEIEYALDTLKADGVGLLTSYGDVWLGEKRLQPVFDELNRRGTIVYTHPTDAACCHSLANANPATLEWFVDTARSINSLLNDTGTTMGGPPKETSAATRYGNIKFIWSHAGGALLGVASRVVGTVSAADLAGTPKPNSKLYHIRRFYYDTAGSANPLAMQGLKTLAGASQIVFGTDVPYGTSAAIGQALESCGLSPEELQAINRGNALKMLPKYS